MKPLPAAGTRGPQAAQTLSDDEIQQLLEEILDAGRETEEHRQAMNTSAARRRDLIQQVHRSGMSVRRMAAALDYSPSTIRDNLKEA